MEYHHDDPTSNPADPQLPEPDLPGMPGLRPQIHYFNRLPYQQGSCVRYNHPEAPDPTQFVTECPSCLALQENDPATVRAAFDRTINDPTHAISLACVMQFKCIELRTRVLACSRCHQTVLFNTDWKGDTTLFWPFGTSRFNLLIATDEAEWKNLMASDPDCGFCEKLHDNDVDAVAETEAYTNENFPDLNDDPPLL